MRFKRSVHGSKGYVHKVMLIMKLTVILLITGFLQIGLAASGQRVSLNAKNQSLEQVFKQIRSQTSYDFILDKKLLKKAKSVDVQLSNASLDEAMSQILAGQALEYSIQEKTIVIKEKAPSFLDKASVILNSVQDLFRAIDIRGKIIGENGEVLVGATVKVKGTNKITKSNEKGEFYLANVDEGAVLEISYIGFKALEIPVKGAVMPLEIKLNVATGELEEVKVTYSTGYQNIPKERATGSFTVIDNKTFNEQVGTNVLKRLDGVASGFQTIDKQDRNRKLGIAIRGLSTINGPLDPLIVLDGFIYEGDINNINPNDIDNVVLLKDAAAASIWGARAGNGVVVITSKKGKFNQKAQVSISSTLIVGDKPDLKRLPRMSSSDYIDIEQFLFKQGYFDNKINSTPYLALTPAVEIFNRTKNGLISKADSSSMINALKQIDSRDDYSEYFYTHPTTMQYAANLTGGSNNNAYTFSTAYDQNIGNTYEKYNKLNIRVNNSYKPIEKLTIDIGAQYTDSKIMSGRQLTDNSITYAGRQVPYLRLTDDAGNALPVYSYLRKSFLDTVGAGKLLDWNYYPLNDYKYNTNTTKLQELYATAGVKYSIFKGIDLSVNYQYQKQSTETENVSEVESYYTRNLINSFTQINRTTGVVKYNVPIGGIRVLSTPKIQSHTFRGQLNTDRVWGTHQLSSIIGTEIREINTFGINGNTFYGYSADPLTYVPVNHLAEYPHLINGVGVIDNGESLMDVTNKFVSVYTNNAYTFKEKYTLSISARRDGSNVFGAKTNDKWKPLWSSGILWRASKEEFYSIDILPVLDFRVTYGTSGNVDLSRSALPVATYGTDARSNLIKARINQLNNPELRWEKVKTLNFRLDFSFKSNLLSGSVEYYRKRSSDLYAPAPYDYTTYGVSPTVIQNVADLESKGFDVVLNSVNINSAFRWTSTLIYNYNIDKTLSYFNEESKSLLSLLGAGNIIVPVIGKPLYAISAYKWAGLDDQGNPQGYFGGKPSIDYGAIATEAMLNGNGENFIYKGSMTPTHFGNLTNVFTYKNVSLLANMSYRLGYYFRKPRISYNALVEGVASFGEYANRWMKPGDELSTDVPSFVYPANFLRDGFYGSSEVNILRADHVRLQYVSLSYALTRDNMRRISMPLRSLSISLTASDLGILWRANSMQLDPDYPESIRPARSIAFKLNATF
jgi:TonB-linked SusC/RagA family outer membrane protein